MSKIYISLLDHLNNLIIERLVIKPKDYEELLYLINQEFKIEYQNYEIFIIDKNNNESKINKKEQYNLIEDILFIREIDKNRLKQSLFQMNYDKLSESKQEILDDNFNCILCSIIIKNEKPYLCYKCQTIYHQKCLKDWDKKCKSQNNKLSCPHCRNELPLEKWNIKLDYEDYRMNNASLLDEINKYKSYINLNNNIILIKNKIIDKLKNKSVNINKLLSQFSNYIKETFELFTYILKKLKSIHSLLQLKSNNKLDYISDNFPINFNNLELENISHIIKEELYFIENSFLKNCTKDFNNNSHLIDEKNDYNIDSYTEITKNLYINDDNKKIKEKKKEFKKIDLIYLTKDNNDYNIFGEEFVKNNKDNIELIINGEKSELLSEYNLKQGENIISVIIKNKLTNLSNMFYHCNSLINIEELKILNVEEVTNFSSMFSNCSSLLDIKALKNWNVSNGIDFSGMFNKCTKLSDISSLGNWNFSNCKYFSSMFSNCSSLSDIKPLENWNVSNVVDFSSMFNKCSRLSDIKPLESWNVSSGINFAYMFHKCSSLSNMKPLEKWKVNERALEHIK